MQGTVESTVTEIHDYPPCPEDFAEPLFPTPESKRAVMEHFLEAPWLGRASEIGSGPARGLPGRLAGRTAHRCDEPVELRRSASRRSTGHSPGPRIEVIRSGSVRSFPGGSSRCRGCWRRRAVVRVIECWREVAGWWDPESAWALDRTVFRVELVGGAVVDLARQCNVSEDRTGGRLGSAWRLVGVVD